MIKEFRLPDAGEGLTEADIVSWHVKPGDQVTVNQVIVEIETAKAVVELPSPFDGTVSELLVPEGQTVDVGTPIITVEVAVEAGGSVGAAEDRAAADRAAAAAEAANAANAADPDTAGAQSVLVGYGVRPSATTRRRRPTGPTGPTGPTASPAPSRLVPHPPETGTGSRPRRGRWRSHRCGSWRRTSGSISGRSLDPGPAG